MAANSSFKARAKEGEEQQVVSSKSHSNRERATDCNRESQDVSLEDAPHKMAKSTMFKEDSPQHKVKEGRDSGVNNNTDLYPVTDSKITNTKREALITSRTNSRDYPRTFHQLSSN